MGKKLELTEEQLQRCYKLHEKRIPYTKIGEELGVDRRIIAKTIKAKDQENLFDKLGDARRDVAAGYFNEHIKNLELLSRYLLEITIPPQMKNIPLIPVGGLEVALLTKYKETIFAKKEVDYSLEGDITTETLLISKHMVEKEAQETLQAHKEHFPLCWQKIHQWEKLATQYNSAFNELEKICETIEIPKSFVRSAIFTIVKKMEIGNLNIERFTKMPSTVISSTRQATLKLAGHGLARRALLQLVQTKSGFDDIFKQIENILSLYQQHKTILATRCKYCPIP